jgi:membrane fusion protein, copper/silver efflux system
VQADETRIVAVQSRAAGWVERLHVRAVNDKVSRGQLLVEIYSPELLAAQEEYLLLSQRSVNEADLALAQAARQRLSLLGLAEPQIAKLEQTRHAQRTVSVHAPASGIVTELGVRQGAQVSPGMAMFNLVDLSSLWVVAEVPEDQIGSVQAGTAVNATLAAYPADRFAGKVDYIYPGVNSETRTVRVRSVITNAQLKLKPGMVAGVHIEGRASKQAVLVPSEAVIRTGTRTAVVVQDEPGKFRPALVTTGVESRGKTEVLSGIEAGEQVVISGQFLIDSEANLQTGLSRLGETESKP